MVASTSPTNSTPGKDSPPPTSAGKTSAKKPVHVKWHNKTIALGTFTLDEAEEKCRKAKALTRMWRLSMKPKPSYDWVVRELEKAGVRDIKTPKSGTITGHELRSDHDHYEQDATAAALLQQTQQQLQQQQLQQQQQQRLSAAGLAGFGTGGPSAAATTLREDSETARFGGMLPRPQTGLTGPGLDGPSLGASNLRSVADIRQVLALQEAKERRAAALGGGNGLGNILDENSLAGARAAAAGLGGGRGAGAGGGLTARDLIQAELGSLPRNPYYELLRQHHMDLLQELQETTVAMRALEDQMLDQAYSAAAPAGNSSGLPAGLQLPPGLASKFHHATAGF